MMKPTRLTMEMIMAEHSNVIGGTLSWLDVEEKQAVQIKCGTEGCENKRTVRTSDLHQVKFCDTCTIKARRERSKAKRAAKKVLA